MDFYIVWFAYTQWKSSCKRLGLCSTELGLTCDIIDVYTYGTTHACIACHYSLKFISEVHLLWHNTVINQYYLLDHDSKNLLD